MNPKKQLMASLVYLCLAFLAGVAAGSRLAVEPVPAFVATAGCAAVCLSFRRGQWPVAIVGFFGLGVLSIGTRLQVFESRAGWVRRLGPISRCTVSGTVRWAEGRADSRWVAELNDVEMACEEDAGVVRSRWSAKVDLFGMGNRPPVFPGDTVLCRGLLKTRFPGSPLGRRALVAGRVARMWVDRPFAVARLVRPVEARHVPFRLLAAVRHRAESVLLRLKPGSGRRLLWAMLLGPSGQAGASIRRGFNRLGLTHLLVISGLHMGLLAALVYLGWLHLFRRWNWLAVHRPARRLAAWATLPVLWIYAGMAGGSPATFRAAVMATFVLAAQMTARPAGTINSVAISAMVLLIWRPSWLFTPGFQLSYAAVLCLVWASRHCRSGASAPDGRRSLWKRVLFGMKQTALGSVAATVGTSPLVAHYFGRIAVIAVPANIVAVPLFCVGVLPCAFAGLCLGVAIPEVGAAVLVPLAHLAGWVASGLCRAADIAPEVAGLGGPNSFEVFNLYLLLFCLFGWRDVFGGRLFRSVRVVLSSLAVTGFALSILCRPAPADQLRITFLDVGSGDATLVELPRGEVVLVDGGGRNRRGVDAGRRVILPFLERRGIKALDVVVLTHPHADHMGGLKTILSQMPTGELWIGAVSSRDPAVRPLLEVARARGIRVRTAGRIRSGSATFEVVHPAPLGNGKVRSYAALSVNDNSLVIQVAHPAGRVLLTGDIGRAAERLLAARPSRIGAEVLKVPHHGSPHSSTGLFVRTVRPCLAIVTGSQSPRVLREITGRYTRIGAALLATSTHGHLTVTVGRKGITVSSGRGPAKSVGACRRHIR